MFSSIFSYLFLCNIFELRNFVLFCLSFISLVKLSLVVFFSLGSVLLSMPCDFQSKMIVLDAPEQLSCMWPEAKAVWTCI